MGAGQSILESEDQSQERVVLSNTEIEILLGKTIFNNFDFSKEYYKPYNDPRKLQKLKDAYDLSVKNHNPNAYAEAMNFQKLKDAEAMKQK